MQEIGRKHPPHQPVRQRHNIPIVIFLTVCTKDRKPILANPAAHEILLQAWRIARSWITGRYIVMPDHVHLFCAPGDLISPAVNDVGEILEVKLGTPLAALWRRSDLAAPLLGHAITTWRKLRCKMGIRYGKPGARRFVNRSGDWPYQGELNVLRW